MGSGTTALVALQHRRSFIGCELNPEYGQIALKRLQPYLNHPSKTASSSRLQNSKPSASQPTAQKKDSQKRLEVFG
jgi:DNA modification methylase